MPWEEQLTFNQISGKASTDLSAKQYFAVTIGSSGIALATAAKACDGILLDNPTSGHAGAIATEGITKAAISASQSVSVGSLFEVDTGGTLKILASGTAVAKAMEALTSVGSVQILTVRLLPANAAFS